MLGYKTCDSLSLDYPRDSAKLPIPRLIVNAIIYISFLLYFNLLYLSKLPPQHEIIRIFAFNTLEFKSQKRITNQILHGHITLRISV